MSERRAEVRARYMAAFLQAVERRPEREAVLAGLPADRLDEIRRASSIAWTDTDIDADLAEAVYRVLGRDAADDFFRSLFAEFIDSPILKAFIQSTVRLFGGDAAKILQRVPTGFNLLFRHYGQWEFAEEGPGRLVLRLVDVHPPLAGHETWARAVAASLEALFPLAKTTGEVALVEVGADRAVMRATWS